MDAVVSRWIRIAAKPDLSNARDCALGWARNAPQSGALDITEFSVLYNPAYRNGSVYLTFGVCEPPSGNGCKNAVRFLQFDPTANSGTYTTIPIGPPDQFVAAPVLDAGFPALDVNAAISRSVS